MNTTQYAIETRPASDSKVSIGTWTNVSTTSDWSAARVEMISARDAAKGAADVRVVDHTGRVLALALGKSYESA